MREIALVVLIFAETFAGRLLCDLARFPSWIGWTSTMAVAVALGFVVRS